MSVLHPSLYYDLLGQPSKLYPAPPHFGSSSLSSNPFLQVSCVFLHVHVHVDTCMQPAIWIVRCLCMWKGGQHWLSFSIAFHYILLKQKIPLTLKPTDSSCQAGQWDPDILSTSLKWDHWYIWLKLALTWVWGLNSKTRVCVEDILLTETSPSPFVSPIWVMKWGKTTFTFLSWEKDLLFLLTSNYFLCMHFS